MHVHVHVHAYVQSLFLRHADFTFPCLSPSRRDLLSACMNCLCTFNESGTLAELLLPCGSFCCPGSKSPSLSLTQRPPGSWLRTRRVGRPNQGCGRRFKLVTRRFKHARLVAEILKSQLSHGCPAQRDCTHRALKRLTRGILLGTPPCQSGLRYTPALAPYLGAGTGRPGCRSCVLEDAK